MSNQDKLIKQGIKYTDKLFAEITNRVNQGVRKSDTLEEFLVAYHKAFPEKGNPLVSLGYDKEMLDIILSETNNHKFSKPAQKELVRITVNDRVGDLIVDVGDDVKESVREIVRDGYDRNLSQDEIALNISNRVGVIKNKRARAIARTEIARTATISDYVINKERGANGWYVECRNTACKVCKNAWHKGWTPESDESFKPSDTSAGGKGWIGDRIFSMNDTSMLPPVHPSCRCIVYYTTEEPNVSIEPTPQTTTTTTQTTTTADELPFKPNNELLKGKPIIYDDVDGEGHAVKVYKYENIELAFNENAGITHEELRDHINSLPKTFEKTYAKRIYIHDYPSNCGGVWRPNQKTLHVYSPNTSKENKLNVFNHEFAHSIDMPRAKDNDWEYLWSHPTMYKNIFKKDNEVGYKAFGIVEPEVPIKFVTNYAGRSYFKFSKNPDTLERIYSEDFAESSARYLNPNTHEWFVKEFPNRARYLEALYGKPDFEHSIFNKLSKEDKIRKNESEFKRVKKEDIIGWYTDVMREQEDAYFRQQMDIQQRQDDLKTKRKEYSAKARECETDECYDKWRGKARAIRVEIKRLQKVNNELSEESYNLLQKRFAFQDKIK